MKNNKISQLFAISTMCTNLLHVNTAATMPPAITATDQPVEEKAIPTQKDAAMQAAWKYVTRLPLNIGPQALELAGMGDFGLYANEALKRPEKSPFRLLQFSQERRLPAKIWSLSFENDSSQFVDHLDVKWGLCAGVTYLNRRMNMLAHYDPENLFAQEVPDRKKQREAWIKFLKLKIDDIMALKMAIIPGFQNLGEFSSVPEIKTYLKLKTIELWQEKNVNLLQGIRQGSLSTQKEHMSTDEIDRLYGRLNLRLGFGYNPIVYLVQHAESLTAPHQWIHTLQVFSVSERSPDGSFNFEVWDINNKAPYATVNVSVDKEGYAHFNGRKLGSVELLQWDDLEVATIITKNVEFCVKNPELCQPLKKMAEN